MEYFQVAHVIAPLFLTLTVFVTTLVFFALHPQSYGFLPLFLKDYKLD
jgi:hypothetical protein